MGMAASQARLLTITSRLHDVEYKAQNIESQKIQLATQKDELYKKYCDAQEATKIQIAIGSAGAIKYVDANFANITSYNPSRKTDYCLKDARTNKVIVDQDTFDMYELYNDKYVFAWAMMGYNDTLMEGMDNGGEDPEFVGRDNQAGNSLVAMDYYENAVYEAHQDDEQLVAAYEEFEKAEGEEKNEKLATFRDYLYKKYKKDIYEKLNPRLDDGEEYNEIDSAMFNFYVHLFENIEANGGCITITDFCESGKADNEWLNNVIGSGEVLIDVYEKNGPNSGWVETSVTSSTKENYLQEVHDTDGLKKAEAEYEYELSVINRKDTKFDKELSKLETERSALNTELESIKKVKQDNVERTYNIFS